MRLSFAERILRGQKWVFPIVADTGEPIEGVINCTVQSCIDGPTRVAFEFYDLQPKAPLSTGARDNGTTDCRKT